MRHTFQGSFMHQVNSERMDKQAGETIYKLWELTNLKIGSNRQSW